MASAHVCFVVLHGGQRSRAVFVAGDCPRQTLALVALGAGPSAETPGTRLRLSQAFLLVGGSGDDSRAVLRFDAGSGSVRVWWVTGGGPCGPS